MFGGLLLDRKCEKYQKIDISLYNMSKILELLEAGVFEIFKNLIAMLKQFEEKVKYLNIPEKYLSAL